MFYQKAPLTPHLSTTDYRKAWKLLIKGVQVQDNSQIQCCLMSKKPCWDLPLEPSRSVVVGGTHHEVAAKASIFSPFSKSLSGFVSISHVAVSVEHNFTGSEANHRVICSSISAASRTTLMPHTGGPQDYRQTRPVSPCVHSGIKHTTWERQLYFEREKKTELVISEASSLIQMNWWHVTEHPLLCVAIFCPRYYW